MYYALINNDRRISAMSPFNDVFHDIEEKRNYFLTTILLVIKEYF